MDAVGYLERAEERISLGGLAKGVLFNRKEDGTVSYYVMGAIIIDGSTRPRPPPPSSGTPR